MAYIIQKNQRNGFGETTLQMFAVSVSEMSECGHRHGKNKVECPSKTLQSTISSSEDRKVPPPVSTQHTRAYCHLTGSVHDPCNFNTRKTVILFV